MCALNYLNYLLKYFLQLPKTLSVPPSRATADWAMASQRAMSLSTQSRRRRRSDVEDMSDESLSCEEDWDNRPKKVARNYEVNLVQPVCCFIKKSYYKKLNAKYYVLYAQC